MKIKLCACIAPGGSVDVGLGLLGIFSPDKTLAGLGDATFANFECVKSFYDLRFIEIETTKFNK